MKRQWQSIKSETWERAQSLRKSMTQAEQVLWRHLRGGKLNVRFRKQHPIGPYIVDFCAPSKSLVVEIDGHVHGNPHVVEHDNLRTTFLESKGWRIVRFTNSEVIYFGEKVLAEIARHLEE